MSNKIRVGILFGGKSAEHEVSLQSAKNIVEAIDKEKYEVVLIGIDKQGRWYLNDESHFLLNSENPKLISLNKSNKNVALVTGKSGEREIVSVTAHASFGTIDVVFPILHGTFGEDGTVQGLLKLANVPFVGAGVLGSAVAMDKDVMKRLLRDAGIPIGKFLIIFVRRKILYLPIQAAISPFGTMANSQLSGAARESLLAMVLIRFTTGKSGFRTHKILILKTRRAVSLVQQTRMQPT